jgi:3-methyladenine DNA glycosylase AlkC
VSKRIPLKDLLFNSAKVEQIAGEIAAAQPRFRAGRFVADVLGRFPELELKARIGWMAECLERHLPGGYRQGIEVILASLPPPNDPTRSDGDFGDFIYAPYADYVARRGCTAADATFSLAALRELTMRFSAEDAIRPFINSFPELTRRTMEQWASDDNYHVRRLCSEGTRPLLPWSRRLETPPDYAIDLISRLHADPTRFVTRSVANHVNDLSKLDADLALALLQDWLDAGHQEARESWTTWFAMPCERS